MQKENKIVFSLDRPNKPVNDVEFYNVCKELLKRGFKVNRCWGIYKGQRERSIIASWSGEYPSDYIEWLSLGFDQDCILRICSKNEAYMDDLRGNKKYIGKWVVFSPQPDVDNGDYTLDMDNNIYYKVI